MNCFATYYKIKCTIFYSIVRQIIDNVHIVAWIEDSHSPRSCLSFTNLFFVRANDAEYILVKEYYNL